MFYGRDLVIITVISLLVYAPISHAYIDPGAGGSILAGLAALLFSTGVFIRAYWEKLKKIVFRSGGREEQVDQTDGIDESKNLSAPVNRSGGDEK